MNRFVRVMQLAPGTLCALVLVRSLEEPVVHAQLAPDRSFTHEADERSGPLGPGDGRGAPPAAYAACVDRAQGDDCTVSFGDRTIEGSCITGLDDELFCLPDDMPPPPPGEGRQPPPDGRRVSAPTR